MMANAHARSTTIRGHKPLKRCGVAVAATMLLALAVLLLGGGTALGLYGGENVGPNFVNGVDSGHGNDAAGDVVMTATGIWMAGQVRSSAGDLNASLARYGTASDMSGTWQVWTSPNGGNDAAYDIAVRGSYVYTSGASRNSAGDLDLLIVRWNADGLMPMWGKRFNGLAKMDDVATDVVIDAQGNVIVCGTSQGPIGKDWVVLKYSPSGKRLWTWKYDGAVHGDDDPVEMIVDSARNVYVTGTTVTGALLSAAYTVKLSPAGKKLWARKYAGPEDKRTIGRALARRPGGGVYVGGHTSQESHGFDMFLLGYSENGTRKWQTLFVGGAQGIAKSQWLNDIGVASDGSIVGVGSEGPDGDRDPVWVVWRPTGLPHISWDTTTSPGDDWWQAVACDTFGGFYMTGRKAAATPTLAIRRMSVRPAAGEWGYWWASPDATEREAAAIAVYRSDVVVVGSMKFNDGTDLDQFMSYWRY